MSVKAFELVPALERQKLMTDRAKTQIVCIECCGKNLYLGTDDCVVVHYVVEEQIAANGKVTFNCEKQGHKYLSLKKPINQLKAASALNRIIVLCDNTLTLLNMFDLEPILSGAKIKGVTSFCLNENPVSSNPFSVEICVSLKKRSLQIYTVTEDRVTLLKDISTPEIPVNMSLDGTFVCTALQTQYMIINFETGHLQELFPYDSEHVKPIVTRISREEFLLAAPGALGMFALANGVSQRPPLQWSENLLAVIYTHPYILALNDEFVTVHSILDQQQKQSLPFQGGQYLGEFDGRIFVASSREIYALVPVAIEKQIQALLVDKRVQEALDLAKNARKTGLNKDKFLKMYRRIQQQAAFIELAEMRFDEARQLFKSGQVDIREVIHLYPHLLPSSTNFTRSVPALHEIADVTQLARGDAAKVKQYKEFLVPFLEDVRASKEGVGYLKEIDTALLKLYAEQDSEQLEAHIVAATTCDVDDCVTWLQRYDHHHALGTLYHCHGDNEKALGVWTRIIDGELQDSKSPGMDFIVEFLTNMSDHNLIWKYVDWVLERDQDAGVKIFTERPATDTHTERLRPDTVVDYLSRYPKAVIAYLEHLVLYRTLQKEKFHTHLAVLYLDHVLRLLQTPDVNQEEVDSARSKLRHLLQTSSLYRVQLLLGKIKDTAMYAECAILYGKLEEHDKALRLLVHKLRDFGTAENYCLMNAKGKDLAYRKRLFQILLWVYLDPNNERRDALIAPAVALLNNNKADFDTIKVLQLLPDHWSVGLLSQFLTSSVRKSLDGSRTSRLERMLARGQNLNIKKESIRLLSDGLTLAEDRLCAVCGRGFSETTFVRYPNGVLTHIHCAKNKYVCPVTGKLFGTTRPPPPPASLGTPSSSSLSSPSTSPSTSLPTSPSSRQYQSLSNKSLTNAS